MFKQTTKEALILILAAVGIALAVYAVRPDKMMTIRSVPDRDDAQPSPGNGGVSEISIQDALRLFEQKSAIFADARHEADFSAGHIQGAVNLAMTDQARWLSDFLAASDPSAVIITYCDGDSCHLATELAEFLFFNGFDRVVYLKNGWTRWRENGLPVE